VPIMRSKTMRSGLLVTALMSSSALGGAALAQDGGVALEEVVVTAQKRSENLQDVPVSIQALGETKLQQLQVTNFADYVKFLPSVSFTGSGSGFNQVYMRGVASGGDGNHSGSLPSVGIYLDEQPITTIQGALDIHVYDIARVEALAGPQGTLYGASSQAGTIRIITNKPSTAGFKAGYDLEVNTVAEGEAGYVAEGFINQPLSDTVAVRLVAWSKRAGGYIDNVPSTRTYPTSGVTIDNDGVARKDYNEVETRGARAAVKVDIGDNWSVTPQVMGQVQKSKGFAGYDPEVGDLEISHYYPESADDRWVQAALTVEGKISNLDIVYAGSYLERTVETEQDYTDYSYFYDTLYGYGAYWTDDAGNPVDPSQYINGKDRYSKVSHELRVTSPQENRLRFVAGLFYQRQTHGIHQDYKIDALGDSLSVEGHPGTIWLTEQKRVDRDSAAFGEVSFDILPKLTATAGIRFFKADNSLVGFYGYGSGYSSGTGVAACFKGAVVAGSPCTNLDKRVKETGNTPKFNLTYKVDDDKLVYVTYSEGFRPGGINRRGTLAPYLSDYLKNYEFGWKTSWAQNRFRWNGAAYFEKWDKFQFSILGPNGLTEIRNAGAAEIKGLESDITWAVIHGLTINAAAAYTDARLAENYCGFTDSAGNPVTTCASPQAPSGTRLPVTPKYKANVTARYEFDAGSFRAFVQGSGVGQSDVFSDLRTEESGILGTGGGFVTFDLSAGLSRDTWSLSAYITNVGDKRASNNRFVQCAEAVCGDNVYVIPNQPRTMGLKFGQKF